MGSKLKEVVKNEKQKVQKERKYSKRKMNVGKRKPHLYGFASTHHKEIWKNRNIRKGQKPGVGKKSVQDQGKCNLRCKQKVYIIVLIF